MSSSDFTPEEIEHLLERKKERPACWEKIFQQYDREGDIEDVVRFSDEDGEVEPENNSFDDSEAEDIDIQKENSGSDANHQCIDVSSDDEEQQKFLNVFKEFAQERIETVRKVYEKHLTEEKQKTTKDAHYKQSKRETVLQQEDRCVVNSPTRRTLQPKSLTFGPKAISEPQAINSNSSSSSSNNKNNNGCLDLVRPSHDFGIRGHEHDNGVVSTMNESVINSPLVRKNGFTYFERTVTQTTTVTVTEKVVVPTNSNEDSSLLPTIDLDDESFDEDSNEASPTKWSTPKSSNHKTSNYEAYSETQYCTQSGTPTKRASYLQIEIANTTPKPAKASKKSHRSSISHSVQKICISGKDVQKSIQKKCPTADIDRLKSRQITIDKPGESLLIECSPVVAPKQGSGGDILSRLKRKSEALAVRQRDQSF